MTKKIEDTLDSEERRAALRSVRKYATFAAGTSLVVLSSTEAVKAHRCSISHTHGGGGGNGGGSGGISC